MSLITCDKVYKTFIDGSSEVTALEETSFSIEKGEFVAIIGPSGSGKSTILTLLGGLQRPSGGDIYIDGISYSSKSEKQMSQLRFHEIGFVLQSSNLIPYLKIEEQFKLVDQVQKRKFQKEKTEKMLKSFGIEKLRNKYPSDLSGGERQRAAIARAIYPDPSLLLADEPTASLDSKKAFEVAQILKDYTKESMKSTIMVTHDERLLKYCDRIFYIEDGRLEEKK